MPVSLLRTIQHGNRHRPGWIRLSQHQLTVAPRDPLTILLYIGLYLFLFLVPPSPPPTYRTIPSCLFVAEILWVYSCALQLCGGSIYSMLCIVDWAASSLVLMWSLSTWSSRHPDIEVVCYCHRSQCCMSRLGRVPFAHSCLKPMYRRYSVLPFSRWRAVWHAGGGGYVSGRPHGSLGAVLRSTVRTTFKQLHDSNPLQSVFANRGNQCELGHSPETWPFLWHGGWKSTVWHFIFPLLQMKYKHWQIICEEVVVLNV